MSRIGKKEIKIPSNTEVLIDKSSIIIKGSKGQMSYKLPKGINVLQEEKKIIVQKENETKESQALHGLSRSIINNMTIGVSEGFTKRLAIQGVGYRAQMNGKNLILNLGYSHIVEIKPPEEITIKTEGNTTIIISGISKEKVGQIAAQIRSTRPPEPYKGKGIRYENEQVRRKIGKAGK